MEEHQPLCRSLQYMHYFMHFLSSIQMFSLPCVLLLLAGRVFPYSTHLSTRTELLVEMWPAGRPFWWDEMHEMNSLDLRFPPSHLIRQLSNTAGTCSQAVLLSTLRHVQSHRLSSSSFPQFITTAPETQTSCCLEKLSEYRS